MFFPNCACLSCFDSFGGKVATKDNMENTNPMKKQASITSFFKTPESKRQKLEQDQKAEKIKVIKLIKPLTANNENKIEELHKEEQDPELWPEEYEVEEILDYSWCHEKV